LLTDFGVAKFTTATATASQNVRGTPAYMAPEQWEGEPVAATDQYALAVMAYSLLTGRPPFVGRMEQVMRQHFNATPQPPSTFNAQIPPALDAVLLHALEKQPEKRFATITHFANAFKQAALQEATASVVSQSKQAQPSGTQSVPRTLPDGLPPTVYQSKPEQKPLEPTVPVLEPNGFVAEKADAAAATSSFPSKSLPPAPQSKSRSHMRTFVLLDSYWALFSRVPLVSLCITIELLNKAAMLPQRSKHLAPRILIRLICQDREHLPSTIL